MKFSNLLRRCDRGQLILELRGTLPPHQQGPPLHIHHFEDEDGTVTAGTLSAIVGDRTITAGPGESVTLPRGVPHRWWNDGDTQLAFHGTVRPLADLDRYLQAIFEVINAGPKGRPPLFYMAHLVLRHGRTQSALLMPPAVQTAAVPDRGGDRHAARALQGQGLARLPGALRRRPDRVRAEAGPGDGAHRRASVTESGRAADASGHAPMSHLRL